MSCKATCCRLRATVVLDRATRARRVNRRAAADAERAVLRDAHRHAAYAIAHETRLVCIARQLRALVIVALADFAAARAAAHFARVCQRNICRHNKCARRRRVRVR